MGMNDIRGSHVIDDDEDLFDPPGGDELRDDQLFDPLGPELDTSPSALAVACGEDGPADAPDQRMAAAAVQADRPVRPHDVREPRRLSRSPRRRRSRRPRMGCSAAREQHVVGVAAVLEDAGEPGTFASWTGSGRAHSARGGGGVRRGGRNAVFMW